jgi:stearoyl-CoA desaturase (delta-9 desaturase)
MRVVYVWHATGLVNSLGHVRGRRRFDTPDNSHNIWWAALMTFGDSWHNNHHAYPASARHGLDWYEIDVNWYLIWTMKKLGLIREVRLANPREGPRAPAKSGGASTSAS